MPTATALLAPRAEDLVLAARSADLPGGLHVLRAMLQRQRRIVGAFVFLDRMGPVACLPDQEITATVRTRSGPKQMLRVRTLIPFEW